MFSTIFNNCFVHISSYVNANFRRDQVNLSSQKAQEKVVSSLLKFKKFILCLAKYIWSKDCYPECREINSKKKQV